MFFQQLLTSEKVIFCLYVAIAALTILGLIVFGIILAKLTGRKFIKSCKVISDFANEIGTINDDNLEQFEATCLDDKTNPTILEGWEAFKAQRFGYPSEYVDKEKTLAGFQPKKFKTGLAIYVALVFAIAVITAVYAIITTASYQYCLAFAVVAMVIPVILLLAYVFVKPQKKAEAAFDQTMDDLDTAVQLQKLVGRKVDNSRLNEIAGRIRDVIMAEQSKPIPSKKDQLEKRKLAAEARESVDDVRDDLFGDDEPAFTDEPVEYSAEEVPAEETAPVEETIAEEAPAEEAVAEPVTEPVEEVPVEEAPVEEAPAPKKVIKFEPFAAVLNDAIDHGYPTMTLRKLANILVLAFTKFTEPAQREALKNSIRRFIVAYKAAAIRESEEAAAEEAVYVAPDAEEIEAEEVDSDEEEIVAPATVDPADLDEVRDELAFDDEPVAVAVPVTAEPPADEEWDRPDAD